MERDFDAARLANEIASDLAGLAVPNTPNMRAIRRKYSRVLKPAAPGQVIQLALLLTSRCRFVAYEIIREHAEASASLTPRQILRLGQGMDSWGAVDCFACILSGPAWRDGTLTTNVVRAWAQSAGRWWRRAAVVSTIALSRRGGIEDVHRVVEICTLVAADPDDMVVKALSWALRELAKKHPDHAEAFLARHNPGLAPQVIREVRCKMKTGLKTPRKRE
jgi:3-methyladenine DNA glycosylase AlkD